MKRMENHIPQEITSAWAKALATIEKCIRPQYFHSFISTIKLLEFRDNTLVLGFAEQFTRDWVYDHYSNFIQDNFDAVSPIKLKLEFQYEPRLSVAQKEAHQGPKPKLILAQDEPPRRAMSASTSPKPAHKGLAGTQSLNPKYGFETFVVGTSNQFAHAASFTVAEEIGRASCKERV